MGRTTRACGEFAAAAGALADAQHCQGALDQSQLIPQEAAAAYIVALFGAWGQHPAI